MSKVGISGGPHTGKSTLFEGLTRAYPDQHFINERARWIIEQELAKGKKDAGYDPVVPWIPAQMRNFNIAVMEGYEAEEARIPAGKTSFQDRTIWDSMFYCAADGCHDMLPDVKRRAKAAGYAMVLFCEPVGTYQQTDYRHETEAEALVKHEGLRRVYEDSGVPMVILPNVSLEDRLVIVEKVLAS